MKTVSPELGQYIYNCLKKHNPVLRNYKEDVLQEINYAIFVCPEEKEALRLSNRLCCKMMRQLGYNSERAKEIYKERCLSAQSAEEGDNDLIEEISRLYSAGCSANEICSRFGVRYDKKINSLLIAAFAGGGEVKYNKQIII